MFYLKNALYHTLCLYVEYAACVAIKSFWIWIWIPFEFELLTTQMQLEHRLSVLLHLYIHSRFNTWLQWIGQRKTARVGEKHLNLGI